MDAKAPLKDRAKYTVVGKPILRTDVPPKCTGRHVYIQDFHVPGMLHGRVIRPAAIGAQLIAVDEASIGAIPDVQIVRVESFLGVVARNEWAAIRAARELKTTWSKGQPLPLSDGLDRTMKARCERARAIGHGARRHRDDTPHGFEATYRDLLLAVPKPCFSRPFLCDRRCKGFRYHDMVVNSGHIRVAFPAREDFQHPGRNAAGELPGWFRIVR